MHDQLIRVKHRAAVRYLVAIKVGNDNHGTVIRERIQGVGITLEIGGISLILRNDNRVWILCGHRCSLEHPVDEVVSFRSRSGKYRRVVHGVTAVTHNDSGFLRECIDRQGDVVRTNIIFRLVLHRFAIPHVILSQHEELILGA